MNRVRIGVVWCGLFGKEVLFGIFSVWTDVRD